MGWQFYRGFSSPRRQHCIAWALLLFIIPFPSPTPSAILTTVTHKNCSQEPHLVSGLRDFITRSQLRTALGASLFGLHVWFALPIRPQPFKLTKNTYVSTTRLILPAQTTPTFGDHSTDKVLWCSTLLQLSTTIIKSLKFIALTCSL
jgi:hypothetical protein